MCSICALASTMGVGSSRGRFSVTAKLKIGIQKEIVFSTRGSKVPVIPCWHRPICHGLSVALSILVVCVLTVGPVLGESS